MRILIRRLQIVVMATCLTVTPACAQKRVALTFDDVPRMTGAFITQDERAEMLITANKAFADPIHKAMPDVPDADGSLTGSMAWEKGIEPPLSPVWITESMSTFLFKRRVLKENKAQ